jgi:hypothetical protein
MNLLLPHQRIIEAHRLASSIYRDLFNYGNNNAVWYTHNLELPDGFMANKSSVKKLAINLNLNLKVISPVKFKSIFFSWSFLKRYLYDFVIELTLLNQRCDVDKRWKNKIQLAGAAEIYSIFTSSFNSPIGRALKAMKKNTVSIEIQHGLLDKSYFPIEADLFYAISDQSHQICIKNGYKEKVRLLDNKIDTPAGSKELIDIKSIKKVILYSKNPGGGCSWKYLKKLELISSLFAKKIDADFELLLHPRDSIFKLLYRHGFKYWVIKRSNNKNNNPKSPVLVISSCSTSFISNTRPGDYCLNIKPEFEDSIRDAIYSWIPSYSLEDLDCKDFINVFVRQNT